MNTVQLWKVIYNILVADLGINSELCECKSLVELLDYLFLYNLHRNNCHCWSKRCWYKFSIVEVEFTVR
ncbi:hypothetical protein QVD17_11119 [Tagetes erecta]|uniref:Uncharacterized protein n=1 Tax=Tagetes erecta TaxID=13708 RepID=A0AAD8LAN7_TARER|nr:hypothetical protein QVD17_11119 [Tagetes erecta]